MDNLDYCKAAWSKARRLSSLQSRKHACVASCTESHCYLWASEERGEPLRGERWALEI
jgi:hypothetical protein